MTKKKQPTTHVFMIIDKSGSMFTLKDDVIGGFNEYIAKLTADTEHTYSITATLFDVVTTPYALAKAPAKVPTMDATSYRPGYGTALYDAVGFTIGSVAQIPPKDKALVVIMTDGEENSSVEETKASVNKKVEDRIKAGWDFIYIGQGIDQWNQAAGMGIRNYVGTQSTHAGTRSTYGVLATASGLYSGGASVKDVTKKIEEETHGK